MEDGDFFSLVAGCSYSIAEAEKMLGCKLSPGQARDFLKDNTNLDSDLIHRIVAEIYN